MKTMHSLDLEFTDKITLMANAGVLRYTRDYDEEKIAKMAPGFSPQADFLLSSSNNSCLSETANLITESGLTEGYQVTLNDIRGILFMWPMITKIIENVPSSMDVKTCLCFFYDLSDNAGHHYLMHEDNYLKPHYLSHFNSKIPDSFTHEISSEELSLLSCFYFFGSNYLDWIGH